MPSWLKCQECGQKYYTATSLRSEEVDEDCEKCGGDLELIEDQDRSN